MRRFNFTSFRCGSNNLLPRHLRLFNELASGAVVPKVFPNGRQVRLSAALENI